MKAHRKPSTPTPAGTPTCKTRLAARRRRSFARGITRSAATAATTAHTRRTSTKQLLIIGSTRPWITTSAQPLPPLSQGTRWSVVRIIYSTAMSVHQVLAPPKHHYCLCFFSVR
ncbi:hypothetical protein ACQJBY_020802 [Aegilops geniculata]